MVLILLKLGALLGNAELVYGCVIHTFGHVVDTLLGCCVVEAAQFGVGVRYQELQFLLVVQVQGNVVLLETVGHDRELAALEGGSLLLGLEDDAVNLLGTLGGYAQVKVGIVV